MGRPTALQQKLRRHPKLAKRLDRVLTEMVHAALWPKSDDGPEANQWRIAEVKRIFKCLGSTKRKTRSQPIRLTTSLPSEYPKGDRAARAAST